ncbi:hypothetical protein GCM10011416_15780 [Polaribacter pacificus]|uniref:Methyltransferase type 11 domain-containing protein n=1 Tax=Polaribacter pacificus TaxID=1775173 RepID=A0A917HYY0_9FLAO|nr:class I SAM-dependent methyltransferase [Polaribacter pacificus]GGG98474.1 hypothetical protein GCM10011416_15780 [Polaribacter pacificus]
MDLVKLQESIAGVDIYLLDQILKKRYQENAVLLDAGCGQGRNLRWFYQNDYTVFGVDHSEKAIAAVKENYPAQAANFSVQALDALSFSDASFDHVISSAVLHFAQNKIHFLHMFSELIRVLKPGGSLFIRMASIQGLEKLVKSQGNGVYAIPDGSFRFLLDQDLLKTVMSRFSITALEPLKTVNVANLRAMSTLVFQKNNEEKDL